jgi:hypothetical protein
MEETMTVHDGRTTTDHDTIREWAESRAVALLAWLTRKMKAAS